MSEVERFDAYYGYPSCRATGRHVHANGEFVLASDYDALANSGALVPVPDGEPCKLMDCTAHCFIYDGKLFTISTRSGAWVSTHTPRQDNPDLLESLHFTTIVQPIRLVPIAEWGDEA